VSSVLLICRQKEVGRALTEILREMDFELIDVLASGAEGRRRLQRIEYDLVILNTPLGDEFGLEFTMDVLDQYDTGVILMVKNELVDTVEEKLAGTTAFIIAKPLNKAALQQNIRFLLASRNKMEKLRKRNDALIKKMDDLKIIYRGKLCLMGYLDMTEEQAHRYIQKQAMDMRLKPVEVAINIIKTYERK